jgi:predicted RNA-binding protein with PUA domain
MIYVLKREEYFINVKGCTFVRVHLMTPEEVEDLLMEGTYDVAATEEAAAVIRDTFGVEIPKVFQGQPPVKQGDKIILLGPNGQVVDITLVY